MTKQEKIREWLAISLREMSHRGKVTLTGWEAWDNLPNINKKLWLSNADSILHYLDSQDVVMKANRELSEFARLLPLDRYAEFNNGYVAGQKFERDTAFKAGFAAVEPLV